MLPPIGPTSNSAPFATLLKQDIQYHLYMHSVEFYTYLGFRFSGVEAGNTLLDLLRNDKPTLMRKLLALDNKALPIMQVQSERCHAWACLLSLNKTHQTG